LILNSLLVLESRSHLSPGTMAQEKKFLGGIPLC